MTEFTPIASLIGGVCIGLAATFLMLLRGRIAGMTGVLAGVLPPFAKDWHWRALFLAGAITAPMLYATASPIAFEVPVSLGALLLGGFLVGIGVTLGSGCTSGHGVCGIARWSLRSIVATCVFLSFAICTVFVLRHVLA